MGQAAEIQNCSHQESPIPLVAVDREVKKRWRIFFVLGTMMFLLFTSMALAEPAAIPEAQEGKRFSAYALEDQHGKSYRLSEDTKLVLIASEMGISKDMNRWLSKKKPDFLEDKKIEYVSDITPMPDIITSLFAGPKMRKYPFRILLANDDEFGTRYPKKEGKIAAFVLKPDRTVSKVGFYENMDEVERQLVVWSW